MSIQPRESLAFAGGAALDYYGALGRRRAHAFRGGEEAAEVFTRTGTASHKDKTGVLRLAETDTPCVHWTDLDASGVFNRPTLQLEPARDNDWTYSEQLNDAAWTKTQCSIGANAGVAPDGASTVDSIIEDANSGNHYVIRNIAGATDDTVQSFSVFAKAGTRTWLRLAVNTKAAAVQNSYVNLANGATGTVHANHTVWVEPYGNSFYRIHISWDVGNGGSTPSVIFGPTTGNDTPTYQGDAASLIYAWGAQLEIDEPYCTSYIQTVAATVTRNGELCYLPYYAGPQEASYYVKFIELGTVVGSSDKLLFVGADAGTDAWLAIDSSGSYYRVRYNDGTSTVASTLAEAPTRGYLVELLATQAADGVVQISQSILSAAATTAAASSSLDPTSTWGDTKLQLNSNGSSNLGVLRINAVIAARGTHSFAEFRALITEAEAYGQQAGGG